MTKDQDTGVPKPQYAGVGKSFREQPVQPPHFMSKKKKAQNGEGTLPESRIKFMPHHDEKHSLFTTPFCDIIHSITDSANIYWAPTVCQVLC